MSNTIDRRKFLKQGIAAAAGLAITPNVLSSRETRISKRGMSQKVIVVGGGLAGLVSAYELTQAGHDVTILEARSRPGGRVYTLREPFSDGLYAEAGATRIPNHHEWTMKYIELFDLQLDPFRSSTHPDLYHLRGKRMKVEHGEEVEWPLDLTPEEKELGMSGMRRKYINSIVKELGDVNSSDWPPEEFKKYDAMTWKEFLRSQGASPAAILLLTSGHSSGLAEHVSALQMLRVTAQNIGRKKMYCIRGGNDALPKAFTSRLHEKIHYNAPVVRIQHDEQGVRVVFDDAGTQRELSAEHLVCAIPFSVLRHVEITPHFSSEKHQAIQDLWHTSIARVCMQTKKRFWLDEELSGFAHTDLPIGESWDVSENQEGPRGILLAYFSGEYAQRVAAMKEEERISSTVDHMEALYPNIKEHFERGVSTCWDEEQWSRGAWAWYKPGQMHSIWHHVARAEGRVHFAGDHASPWPAWMQGAIASGNRVAEEINNAS